MSRNIAFKSIIIGILIVGSPILVSAVFETAPPGPPSCPTNPSDPNYRQGCSNPIHVGSELQTKVGDFGTDGNFAVGGNAGIGGSLSLLNITGSTQCLRVNSLGLISGTGADCGTSGSGTITLNTVSGGGLTGGTGVGSVFTLDADPNILQKRLSYACGASEAIRNISVNGDPTCVAVGGGGISGVTINTSGLLTGGGTGASFNLNVPIQTLDSVIAANGVTTRTFTAGGATFTGNVTATGFIYQSSDERLKSNIQTIPDALEKILQLRGVEYTRNSTGKNEVGVVAQEVERVFPENVETDTNGLKYVDYGHLIGPLIEAVKTQQAEIDDLKTEVSVLRAQVR